ncbi:MAG: gluconolactonase [Nevskia sp.]|nr:gluconolactonase [Nevskia sp.]
MILLVIAVILAAILYFLFWPTRVSPQAWNPPQAPSLAEEPYRLNDKLKALQRIATVGAVGPEGINLDAEGRIYAGYLDGRVMRFAPDGGSGEVLANTGGRPLGMAPLADGRLLVADAIKGLVQIDSSRGVTVLATEADGLPFGFTNDLDVAESGEVVFFSDSSHKWGTGQDIQDIVEHGGHGRLLRYDFRTRKASVLLKGLQFANGVAIGPNEDYVLVTESSEYRVQRYWLKGPKAGCAEIFIDNLPGFPDNISYNGRDRFWLAIAAPRHPLIDLLANKPFLRQVLSRIPASLQPKPVRHCIVLALDLGGKVVANLQHAGPDAYWKITSACEFGPWLYCGSVDETAIGRMPLSDIFADAPPSAVPQQKAVRTAPALE